MAALVRACHPLPTLAVVVFTMGYAAAAGAGPWAVTGLIPAVITGQLAVGWTNDAVDAPLDRAAGRLDKPLVGTALRRSTVSTGAVLAALACVPLSLLGLGTTAGLLHLVAVGSALSYDLALKRTGLSPLPYLVSFGLLPPVAALGTGSHGPPVSHVVGAALLGLAAHFTNTVADTDADAATGVRGLPQRLGPARSLRVSAGALAVAAGVLLAQVLTQPAGAVRTVVAAGLLAAAVAAALAPLMLPGRFPAAGAFRLTLAAVALVLAGLLVGA